MFKRKKRSSNASDQTIQTTNHSTSIYSESPRHNGFGPRELVNRQSSYETSDRLRGAASAAEPRKEPSRKDVNSASSGSPGGRTSPQKEYGACAIESISIQNCVPMLGGDRQDVRRDNQSSLSRPLPTPPLLLSFRPSTRPTHPTPPRGRGYSPDRPVSTNSCLSQSPTRSRPSAGLTRGDIFVQALPSPPGYRSRHHSPSPQPPPLPPRMPASVRQVILSNPASPIPSTFTTPVLPGGFPPQRRVTPTPPRHPQSSPHSLPTASSSAQRNQGSTASSPAFINRSPTHVVVSSSVLGSPSQKSHLSSPLAPLRLSPIRPRPAPESHNTGEDNKKRCRGTIASGKRCTRIVNTDHSSPSPSPAKITKRKKEDPWDAVDYMLRISREDEDKEAEAQEQGQDNLARFCGQHRNQALVERGCFIVTGLDGMGEFIDFDDWISPGLTPSTQLLLRHEMSRSLSAADKPGYIYIHELVSSSTSSSSSPSSSKFIKVGRSVSPVTRLAQWRSSCPSRHPIVRDILPRAEGVARGTNVGLGVTLRIREQGVRFHHRWERLCLIEIAGRVTEEGEKQKPRGKCVDCSKVHLELFEVEREGGYEWILEVVERWMGWVERLEMV